MLPYLLLKLYPRLGGLTVSTHCPETPRRLLVFVDLLDRLAPLHNIQGFLGTAVPNHTYNYRTVVLPIRSLDLIPRPGRQYSNRAAEVLI